jgi:hypothetical protein
VAIFYRIGNPGAMSLPEKTFRRWMDERKLTAAEVSGPLGVSVQTVHNWRSAGVPRRRLPHVRDLMDRWDTISGQCFNSLVIRASPEQFERWNRAALAEGKTLSRWAEDVLHAWAERCAG